MESKSNTRQPKKIDARQRAPVQSKVNEHIRATVCEPLDVETFMYMLHVFDAAASRKMPSTLGAYTTPRREGYYLTDTPINRGIMAVTAELKSIGAPAIQRTTYLWRILDVSELFEHTGRLGRFMTWSESQREWLIHDPLLRALAVTRYKLSGSSAKLDIDHLIACAERFRR